MTSNLRFDLLLKISSVVVCIYVTGLLTFLACAFAIFIVFSEASIAVTSAPKLANDSDKIPPPQPTSRIFFPL